MRTQIIRQCQRLESMVPLSELTRRALINSDSCQYMNKVRYLPRAIRDKWLDNLARKVIELAKELPPTRHRDWVILQRLKPLGYDLEDADIFVLVVRLTRAGYLSREVA